MIIDPLKSAYPVTQSPEKYKHTRMYIMYTEMKIVTPLKYKLTNNVHINMGSNITDYTQN